MASKSSSTFPADTCVLAGVVGFWTGSGEGDGEAPIIEVSPSVAVGLDLAFLSFLAGFGVGSGVVSEDWTSLRLGTYNYNRTAILTSGSVEGLFLLFFCSTSLSLDDSEDETLHDQLFLNKMR